MISNIGKILSLLQKAGKFLEPDLVSAAIASAETTIGPEVVVDDALKRWERSHGFARLLDEIRAGVAFRTFDAFVESFIEDGGFFGDPEVAQHVVGTFIESLDAELRKRVPYEVILARQVQATADLRRDLGLPSQRALPAAAAVADVRAQAARTRATLRPSILPSVSRADVLETITEVLRQSLRSATKHIAGVVAPAGYGKSTVLAQLFDVLTRDPALESTAIALVRGDLLLFDDAKREADLDQRVSEAAGCGSLREIAGAAGGAILLFDTVDLLLTGRAETLVPALLRSYAEAGITIVFTCRDFEFSRSLEPVETRFAGASFSRIALPFFTLAEVRQAARAFLLAASTVSEEDAARFADRIVALSADRRSIEEIVRSPLLLAMLCDVFGATGNVPEDLTTSVLYTKYWDLKVGSSRNRESPDRVAHAKREVCARIGETLYSASESHLQLCVVDGDLTSLGEWTGVAIAELQSEGVLVRGRRDELSFFHQTLAEFAIAKWLTSEAARTARRALLGRLRTDAGMRELHWWPVVRQLIAAMPLDAAAASIVDELDRSNPHAYRAAMLGAAPRDDDPLTLRLAQEAVGDDEKERIACEALASVRRASWPTVAAAALHFIETATTAGVKSAVSLLCQSLRWMTEEERSEIVLRALAALVERVRKQESTFPREAFESTTSRLLRALAERGGASEPLLAFTRAQFRVLGPSANGAMIELHLRSNPDPSVLRELHDILTRRRPGEGTIEPSIALFERLLELGPPHAPWPDFLAMLHAGYPLKWKPLQAKSAARFALRARPHLRALVDSFIGGTHVDADLIALQEAIETDAGTVIERIIERPVASYEDARRKPLSRLLSDARHRVAPARARGVIDWILADASAARDMLTALVAMAGACGDAWPRVLQVYRALPEEQRVKVAGPISLVAGGSPDPYFIAVVHDDIAGLAGSEYAQVDVAARGLLVDRDTYLSILIDAAQSPVENLASAAGNAVESVKAKLLDIPPRRLAPMLDSRFGGVRANALEVLRLQAQEGRLDPEDAAEILRRVSGERVNKHRMLLTNVFGTAVFRSKGAISTKVLDACLEHVLPLLLDTDDIDGGVAREAMNSLATLVRRATEEQLRRLVEPALRIFREFDLDQSNGAETPLRAILHTLDERRPRMLETIAATAPAAPVANQVALALIVLDRRGLHSVLLEQLLRDAPREVSAAVRKRSARF